MKNCTRILFLILLIFSVNAFGSESCVGKYNSVEWNACVARNQDREVQTQRYNEEKKLREDNEKLRERQDRLREEREASKKNLDDISKQQEKKSRRRKEL
jgi:uncharacterized protein YlxW (UPF0749 family)